MCKNVPEAGVTRAEAGRGGGEVREVVRLPRLPGSSLGKPPGGGWETEFPFNGVF